MKVTISEGNAREGGGKKAERTDATRNEAGERGSSDGEGDAAADRLKQQK